MPRNVIVDLKAKTRQYERAMDRAAKSTGGLHQSIARLGKGAAVAGIAGVAVGVAAIGAAAVKVGIEGVKSFTEFEASLAKIEGLVGVPKAELAAMTDELKLLSVETAKGPQELADALFFITSAGLEGADAMDALEVSAKAAAAGLGDTSTIADVVTSAMNAYGDSIGGAAVATDVLVATVREGKAEAPALASAMGRVIPIASKMRISFDQVGAAIAAMTRVGLDANEASTALRSIMTSLLKPGADASRALDEVGLSAAGLREEIRDKGLFSALKNMTTAFEGQDDAVVRVFGNVRALTGVMSLMGDNAGATEQIFQDLAVSTGALDTAFGAAAETGAFAFEQAKVRIENALLDVGEQILPKLLEVLDDIVPLIPEIVASLGDMAIVLVDLAQTALPFVIDGLELLSDAALRAEEGMLNLQRKAHGPIAVADSILTGWADFAEVFTIAEARQLDWVQTQILVRGSLRSGAGPLEVATTAVLKMADAHTINTERMETLRQTLGLSEVEWGAHLVALIANAEALGLTGGQVSELTDLTGEAIPIYEASVRAQEHAAHAAHLLAINTGEVGTAAGPIPGQLGPAITTYAEIGSVLSEAAAAGRSLASAMLELTSPTFKAAKAQQRLAVAEKKVGDVKKDTKHTAEELALAELDVVAATLEAQAALDAVNPVALESSVDVIQDVLGRTDDQARDLLETVGVLDGTEVTMLINVDTRFTGATKFIPEFFGVGDPLRRAHGGPVTAGVPYKVGEEGEEWFVPGRSGTIIPNSQINNIGGNKTINLEVHGSDAPAQDGESLLLLAQIGGM